MLRSLVGSEMCIRDRYQRRVRGSPLLDMLSEANSFVYNVTESVEWRGSTLLPKPYECGDACKLCCCPCCPWQEFSDGRETLRYYNSCCILPCCYNWKVAHVSAPGADPRDIGSLAGAGCCENGCAWCLCWPCICTFPNLLVSKFFTSNQGVFNEEPNNNHFSIRRDVACCDSCALACGLLCYPCLGPCNYFCKYCGGNTAVLSTLPFFPAHGNKRTDGTDEVRYGEFQFASRLMPIGCCCIKVPVRYLVHSNRALSADRTYDAALSLVPVLVRGLSTPTWICDSTCCHVCAAPPVPVPSGISCFDRGLNSVTEWMTFDKLVLKTRAEAVGPVQSTHAAPIQAAPPVQPSSYVQQPQSRPYTSAPPGQA
eukprot:TRINITY_DN16870_c0_g1_i2.p1 TRINITY_DN16870_c0_g1~~TRINITY_DN16870_c0_g1_i2.p1  ORF type:complete len:369 (-),score=65.93 TRINITY_DN16870_c0_g1_i2:417-1523(-)